MNVCVDVCMCVFVLHLSHTLLDTAKYNTHKHDLTAQSQYFTLKVNRVLFCFFERFPVQFDVIARSLSRK